MKKFGKSTSIFLFFIILSNSVQQLQIAPVQGWSHDNQMGHYAIGVAATQIIPEPWLSFFNNNLTGIGDASDYPDFFRVEDRSLLDFESARHYDDSDIIHDDHTSLGGSDDWNLGVLSWAAENATTILTELIKTEASDADLIYQFGFVSHYAADSTMPFHATIDFNGEETGNAGIHDRLEEFEFQQFGDDIFANVTLRQPIYVDDVYLATKANIASGLALVPNYLTADTVAVAEAVKQKSTLAGTKVFYSLMNESIIERITLAIQFTADLWYTAITDAQPTASSSTNVTTSTPISSSTNEDSIFFIYSSVVFLIIPILRKMKSNK